MQFYRKLGEFSTLVYLLSKKQIQDLRTQKNKRQQDISTNFYLYMYKL